MEGHEVTIVSREYVASATPTLRLDPEYFQKQHLHDEEQIALRKGMFSSAEQLKISVDASAFYPSIEEFYGTGEFPFYRVGDVDGIVDEARALCIPEDLCAQFPTLKQVEPGDILFTKGGAIDRAGYVKSAGAVSRDLIFLDTHRLPKNSRLCLFAYFRTTLFRRMLTRSSSQTAQSHLTITLVRELPFFVGSDALGDAVSHAIEGAYAHLDEAKRCVSAAETLLLESLGLANWTPLEPLAYTARASTVSAAARFDARFFAPRIQALIDLLAVDGRTIADVAEPRREKFRQDVCKDFDYIEISDIDGSGAATSTQLASEAAPSRAAWHVRAGDIITSTVRPIRRLSAQITPVQDGFVCSSGFVVVKPRDIAPEVLLTYLRLPVICELLDLFASASMYPSITDADIFNLPLPNIPAIVAEQVTKNVTAAKSAKARAAGLLEAAKRAVEIAIEDGESAAMVYLDQSGGPT
ncbi:conserved hypothetical protein [Stenotrophomonas maltophilia]